MTTIFYHLTLRALRLEYRNRGEWLMPALFFLLAASFLLYLTELSLLAKMNSSYILLLLALLLPLQTLYQEDVRTGFFEILHDADIPLLAYVYSKMVALFTSQLFVLLPACALYALIAGLPQNEMLSYLFGCFLLIYGATFLGGMIVAPLAYMRMQSGFMALLFLPLILPLLIFIASALTQQHFGLAPRAHFQLAAAFAMLASVFCPFVSAKILHLAQQRW